MASSSAGVDETPGPRNDGSEDDSGRLPLQQVGSFLDLTYFPGENNETLVEISSEDPFIRNGRTRHRMSLSDLRLLLGYSDVRYDDDAAALQSTLRANLPHVPAQSADIRHMEAQFDSRITPGKSKCYRTVPHLTSIESSLQCSTNYRIDKTFALDHPDGFWVYKVQGFANWSLFQALATALTIRQSSCQTTILDLYYFYKQAIRDEPVNQIHDGELSPLVRSDRYICAFSWDLVAQALDYYMEFIGQKPHTFVVIQPPDDKTTPVSHVFTVPTRMTEMKLAKMERLWLMYTGPKGKQEAHFNVVMPCGTETGWKHRRLLHSLEDLDQKALHACASEIRSLESDLLANNVSMMSLSLDETRQLLRKTAIERAEHMNRSGFGFDFVDPRGSHPPPSRLSQLCDDKKAKEVPLAPPPYHTTGTASVPRPSNLELPDVLRIKQELVSVEPTARAGTTIGTGEFIKTPSHQKAKDGSSEAEAISISSDTSGGDPIDLEVSNPTHGRGNSTFASSANTSSPPVKENAKADAARTIQSTQAHASSNTESASPSQSSQRPSRSHLGILSYASRAIVRPRPDGADKTTRPKVSPKMDPEDDGSGGLDSNEDNDLIEASSSNTRKDRPAPKLPKPAANVMWNKPLHFIKNVKDIKDIKDKMGKDKGKGKEGKKTEPQSILKRAGPEDIPPPDAKKAKFYHDDEQDMARPRSAILESVNAERQRLEAITRRRNKLLGLGGKKWPLQGGKKK